MIYDAASAVKAKLSSVILNRAWNWGYARSDDLLTIISKLLMVEIGEYDKAVLISSKTGSFSIANAWDHIRQRRPTVNWWRSVWFSKHGSQG